MHMGGRHEPSLRRAEPIEAAERMGTERWEVPSPSPSRYKRPGERPMDMVTVQTQRVCVRTFPFAGKQAVDLMKPLERRLAYKFGKSSSGMAHSHPNNSDIVPNNNRSN